VTFAHALVGRVARMGGDHAALGGAVTVALCGHWDHGDACRWPHLTTTEGVGDEVVVTVRFDAPDDEVAQVCGLITSSLQAGELVGPDGRTTRWQWVG
jgi:hypothetical protein